MKTLFPGEARSILCGALIGAGAILPGVSGGTLAVVFGVYRPLLDLFAHPRQSLPQYWRMLLPLGAGCAGGFLFFAWAIASFLDSSAAAAAWLFVGLIAGTLPALYREAGREGRSAAGYGSMLFCACVLFGGLFYLRHGLRFTAQLGPLWYAFCGVLWGLGVVLPGFTASPLSMALGLYQPMLEQMKNLDWTVYAASLPAMGLTVLLTARGMRWFLGRHYAAAAHGIFGVVCASTLMMIPTEYRGTGEAVLCGGCCAGGFLLALLLSRLDEVLKKRG